MVLEDDSMGLIVGITGKMGAGKTTAAQIMVGKYNFSLLSFATPLKEAACHIFGLKSEDFSTGKEKVDPYWGITRRKMLQVLGTECMRGNFGEDFWVRRAALAVEKLRKHINVVFDDVRFPDEAAWIMSQGGIILRIRTNRVEYTDGLNHASETQVIPAHHTYDNDGSRWELSDFITNFCAGLNK